MTGSNYTAFGSNAMYITRLGSVGIGTTVPSARLHVTGSTGGIFEVDTAGGATTFYVSASGNVGIGTANATDKLTLYGALASYKTGADTIQTQVYLANTGNTRAFNVQLNSGGTGLDLWSYNSSNAWLRHTTFDYNGSVGIGTATSILGKLQLDSGVAPYYGPATGSATPNGMFTLGSVTGDVVNTFGVDASATAYAWIQPRKVTGATYYSLALNPNGGNVGIGITNPGYKLDVGVAGSDVISVRLTPGYERVRFNTFDLLGYNDGNLWMIGNNPTNTLVLGKTWDWDNQIGIAYTQAPLEILEVYYK